MKIFISYTVRDGHINIDVLKEIDRKLSEKYDLYIDLIHNKSRLRQDKVLNELKNSDRLILINTPKVNQSPWVKLELDIAKKRGILITTYKIEDLLDDNFTV